MSDQDIDLESFSCKINFLLFIVIFHIMTGSLRNTLNLHICLSFYNSIIEIVNNTRIIVIELNEY